MSKQYAWKSQYWQSNTIDAEVAFIELERIREENDGLTPATIVDKARPETNPLHPAFEWNNSIAAEKYRHVQARCMVRAIVVIDEQIEQKRPLYVSVNDDGNRLYEAIDVVVQDSDLFTDALDYLLRKLESAEKSVMDLYDIAPEIHQPTIRSLFDGLVKLKKQTREQIAVD